MEGSQVPRLKGGMGEGECDDKEELEIPTPESMMEAVEDVEKPEEEDNNVKGVMLSMSRLAAKPIKKEELKKKGKKVK